MHEITYLNRSLGQYLTFAIIPKSDVLPGHHWSEAGEQYVISDHESKALGVDESCVLQTCGLLNTNKTKEDQMSRHWGE